MATELPIAADQSVSKQMEEILNRTSFGSTAGTHAGNMDGQWITVTTSGVADAENTIAHKLNRTPTGYFVGQRNKAAILYNGSSAWTNTNIYLKCNVATTIFRVYVW